MRVEWSMACRLITQRPGRGSEPQQSRTVNIESGRIGSGKGCSNNYRWNAVHLRYFLAAMSTTREEKQRAVCARYGREFVACSPESKLGLAIQTLGSKPINGLRHLPTEKTNGWFIWSGEYSSSADFFAPLHASHLEDRLPQVIEFLGLPPGTRFLLADDYVDVWSDESLLNV